MFCMMIFFPISSGMFMSASEDNTGILDQIDTKIAKATMIPKTHGEVVCGLRKDISFVLLI